MPWKVSCPMDEKVQFISRRLQGDKMSDLCREFNISRKTGHKFWNRYLKHGINGLNENSKKPLFSPHKTPKEIENIITELRQAKPSWGPKKLKARLQELYQDVPIPAASTIGEILERHGLVQPRKSARKRVYYPTKNTESSKPNDLWCVDFKGQFRMGNKKYCYPLTATDHFSRYLLACEALETTTIEPRFTR